MMIYDHKSGVKLRLQVKCVVGDFRACAGYGDVCPLEVCSGAAGVFVPRKLKVE